jgi:DNA recombination-mediator protein A
MSAGGGVVGVVATGLDVVYPRRHATLFERVRRAGLITGETAFGVQPERWRFPIRNRIIAALAEVALTRYERRTRASWHERVRTRTSGRHPAGARTWQRLTAARSGGSVRAWRRAHVNVARHAPVGMPDRITRPPSCPTFCARLLPGVRGWSRARGESRCGSVASSRCLAPRDLRSAHGARLAGRPSAGRASSVASRPEWSRPAGDLGGARDRDGVGRRWICRPEEWPVRVHRHLVSGEGFVL